MKEKRLLNFHGCLSIVEGKIVKRTIHKVNREFFRVGKEEYPLHWTKPLNEASKDELAKIKAEQNKLAELDLKLDEAKNRLYRRASKKNSKEG